MAPRLVQYGLAAVPPAVQTDRMPRPKDQAIRRFRSPEAAIEGLHKVAKRKRTMADVDRMLVAAQKGVILRLILNKMSAMKKWLSSLRRRFEGLERPPQVLPELPRPLTPEAQLALDALGRSLNKLAALYDAVVRISQLDAEVENDTAGVDQIFGRFHSPQLLLADSVLMECASAGIQKPSPMELALLAVAVRLEQPINLNSTKDTPELRSRTWLQRLKAAEQHRQAAILENANT